MPPRFVALPVGQGDAFYLERDGLSVLVDGGKSNSQATKFLEASLPARHLDVVICTHNDKDHAQGVRGLLESETFSVGEVWLPGRWTERLSQLCKYEKPFFEELERDVERTGHKSLDEVSKDAPERLQLQEDQRRERRDRNGEQETQEVLDDIDRAEEQLHRFWYWPVDPNKEALWSECVHAAERIRGIAIAARNLGCRIRWFDYEEFSSGTAPAGGRPDLKPINSVEITKIRKPRLSALGFLALTVENRESLVFRSPRDAQAPGVLFTADSDLGFSARGLSIEDHELVTAPHHGSEHNANAYAAVDGSVQAAGTLWWIRSDGRFQTRPGAAFRARQARAVCTRCKGDTTPGQRVEFAGAAGGWARAPAVTACHCV